MASYTEEDFYVAVQYIRDDDDVRVMMVAEASREFKIP